MGHAAASREQSGAQKTKGQWWLAEFLRYITRNTSALIGLVLVGAFIVAGTVGIYLAPFDPHAVNLLERLEPPSAEHLLGTDELGRDILSRILYGARISLMIGLMAAGLSLGIGLILGSIAGFYGGWWDTVIMRAIDVLLSFPGILLAIMVIAIAGPGANSVILAAGIFGVPAMSRVVRGEVLRIKEREFVQSAQALGMGNLHILVKYILANSLPPVIVMTTLNIGTAILTGAALSFLGLGVQPPDAEWGAMVSQGRDFIRTAPHVTMIPGLAVFLVVLGFNLLGDGLRDFLDPRTD
ncbi:MAG: ABC transporter permease [Firmicutes bacterium]|nr:ABC transporter permease [Bacillota bacterium]